MKLVLFTAIFVFLLNAGHGISFAITGEDGWTAKIGFENPSALKTPVFFIVSDRNGMTNTEVLLRLSNELRVPMSLPDGEYFYSILDSRHEKLKSGRFVIKTPFRFVLRDSRSDSAVLEITSDDRVAVEIRFGSSNQAERSLRLTVLGKTNCSLAGLNSSSYYNAVISGPGYGKKFGFYTKPRNIALNKPVFGTFNRLPESRYVDDTTPAITRVNDGKWEWYRGMAASGELGSQGQFVYVNLEKTARVRSVKTVWHAFYHPGSYFIVYGTDGRKWQSLARNRRDFRDMIAPDNSPVKVDDAETGFNAQYVGIVINRGEKVYGKHSDKNYVELMELEVYE